MKMLNYIQKRLLDDNSRAFFVSTDKSEAEIASLSVSKNVGKMFVQGKEPEL